MKLVVKVWRIKNQEHDPRCDNPDDVLTREIMNSEMPAIKDIANSMVFKAGYNDADTVSSHRVVATLDEVKNLCKYAQVEISVDSDGEVCLFPNIYVK